MDNNILIADNISYKYDNNIILDGISLSIKEKTINAILSSNNSGKTTLIKIIGGFFEDYSGNITVNNIILNKQNFKKYILNISTVLEDVEQGFICDKVLDELKYPLINLHYKEKNINNIVDKITYLLDLEKIINNRIEELSFFDKIKVLIATSIVHKPKVLLIDDIFRFLNNDEQELLLSIFNIIKDEFNTAILFTTSNLNILKNLENIFVINNGKIVIEGNFNEIILKDNDLSKIGIEIPMMIDLSRKLQFYNLIDEIYYDPDKVVDALWK